MKQLHNIDHIVSIEQGTDKNVFDDYQYFKEKKYWLWKNRQEGWYYNVGLFGEKWESTTVEKIEKEFVINNNVCFHKPYVQVKFSNGDYENITWSTKRECDIYIKRMRLEMGEKLIVL